MLVRNGVPWVWESTNFVEDLSTQVCVWRHCSFLFKGSRITQVCLNVHAMFPGNWHPFHKHQFRKDFCWP